MISNFTEDTIPLIEEAKQAKKIDVNYFKQSSFPRLSKETLLPVAKKVYFYDFFFKIAYIRKMMLVLISILLVMVIFMTALKILEN
jgi:hypothetical protein